MSGAEKKVCIKIYGMESTEVEDKKAPFFNNLFILRFFFCYLFSDIFSPNVKEEKIRSKKKKSDWSAENMVIWKPESYKNSFWFVEKCSI